MSTPGSRVDHGAAEPGHDPSPGLPDPLTLDPQVAVELLRIAREAVTAAVTRRHARSVLAEVARGSTGTGSAAPGRSPEVSAALERPGRPWKGGHEQAQ